MNIEYLLFIEDILKGFYYFNFTTIFPRPAEMTKSFYRNNINKIEFDGDSVYMGRDLLSQ
jgi:hypothetical protein